MAYPPNEGGIGGKLRRRPARTPYKPYDRPPTALRGVKGGGIVTAQRDSWISKILDPASRLITNGAGKLFNYLFRKRLTAPPLEAGEDLHSGAGVSQDTSTIPSSKTRNREMPNGGSGVDNQKHSSDIGTVELVQLFKQRTFTMAEFNRLEELLLSRTVESYNADHENSIDKKGKSVMLASDGVPGSSKVEKGHLVSLNDFASPEVAKSYMGSKLNKGSSLSGSLQGQVPNEEIILKSLASAQRRLDLSVEPRSLTCLSVPEQPQYHINPYQTSEPVGRFAMHRMSRSPYFNVKGAAGPQLRKISMYGHSSPDSSQWTSNSMKSCGKQAFKRGITALDDEYGSLGSIRRIRQKSNLGSPSCIYNSSSSMQKSLYLEEKKNDSTSSATAEEDGMNNSIRLPVQSNENAYNLLGTQETGKAAIPLMTENMDEESSLHQNPAFSGINSKAPQANGVSNTDVPSENVTKLVPMTEPLSSISLSVSKRPFFRISVPEEDFFDLDGDEDGNTNDLSIPSTSSPSASITKTSVRDDSSSNTIVEKPLSSLMLSRKDEKAAMLPVLTRKDNGKVDEGNSFEATQTSSSTTANSANESTLFKSMNAVQLNLNFGNNNSTNTILNNSLSSAAATFSTTAPTSLLQQSDTSKSNGVEANTFKTSSLSLPAPISQDASSVLPTSSPNISTSMASPLFPEKSETSSFPAFASRPIFSFGTSTQSIDSGSSLSETASVFGATGGSTNSTTLFASTQNSIPVVFGATEKTTAVTFGAYNNISSQISSTAMLGADNSNSSQNSSMTISGASNNNSQKPDAITFGGENHNSKFMGFGATDNNPPKPSAITFGAESYNSEKSKIPAFGGAGDDSEKPSAISFGSGNGSISGSKSIQSGSESGQATHASTSQFGVFSSSPSFGLRNSTSGILGNSAFGTVSSSPNPFMSSSGVSFSSSLSINSPFAPPSSASIFRSSSQASSATVFGSSTSSSGAPFQFGSSGTTASPFTLSSPEPFTFSSSSSSATAPFTFNSSSTSVAPASFAFNSSSNAAVLTPTPAFGFSMNSPNNDEMNVEDSMTDASNQAPSFPTFGQPQNPATSPGFMFGSPPPQQNGVPSFSFGGAQNASGPFQPSSSVDFNPGGSFSLGSSAGGDKSARKIIKVKRGIRGRK